MEVWMPVVGWETHYAVSNLGRVMRTSPGKRTRPGKILVTTPNSCGYPYVEIGRKGYKVHALVAAAFIGPRPSGMQINHKDGNKQNNRLENIEYCTQSENIRHSYRHGMHTPVGGEKHGQAKLTALDVARIRTESGSSTALAKKYGVHRKTIMNVKTGGYWKSVA